MDSNKSSFDNHILTTLKEKKQSFNVESLAEFLGITKEKSLKKLKKTIKKLTSKNLIKVKHQQIVLLDKAPHRQTSQAAEGKPSSKTADPKRAFQTQKKGDTPTHIGKLAINRYGVGFVSIDEDKEDIKIPSRWLDVALRGDMVEVQLVHRIKSSRQEGRVVRVVERSNRMMVGVVSFVSKDEVVVTPDDKSAHVDFILQTENVLEEGTKVVFRLKEWQDSGRLPIGEWVETLGSDNTNDAKVLGILAENQFVASFSADIEAEAEQAAQSVTPEILRTRLDLRSENVFTIDPFDAKDFDDGLSIQKLENGNLRLGVHIADVTFYVKPDTKLDAEALSRANSVYLVDRVIPMLPEVLSNGVCSLVPHEDRLAYSCFMELTPRGKLIDYEIVETVIHSKQRFTYEQAQEVIEGKAEHPLSDELLILNKLAKILAKSRFAKGSIAFESPEPRFILDEEGQPIDVIVKERFDAHKLVEECMLMANKTVALHIDKLREHIADKKKAQTQIPFVYRVHDKPDKERLLDVEAVLSPLGIELAPGDKAIQSKDLNKALEKVKGTDYENIVNALVLRAMAKAEYQPANIGHFGLCFDHYAHFTSPIRRYPDVLVHRLLKAYASNERPYAYDRLKQMGEHCSGRERDAQRAERDSVKLKQAEYLSKRVGQEYEGVISGVTEFGVYIELRPIFCEGMVRISDLSDDFYIYDKQRHQLLGKRRGKKYILGQKVTAKVVRVDLEARNIDLLLTT